MCKHLEDSEDRQNAFGQCGPREHLNHMCFTLRAHFYRMHVMVFQIMSSEGYLAEHVNTLLCFLYIHVIAREASDLLCCEIRELPFRRNWWHPACCHADYMMMGFSVCITLCVPSHMQEQKGSHVSCWKFYAMFICVPEWEADLSWYLITSKHAHSSSVMTLIDRLKVSQASVIL